MNIYEPIKITEQCRKNIQQWVNSFDCTMKRDRTFEYGYYDIVVEVDANPELHQIDITVEVYSKFTEKEVPFDGLNTTKMEEEYLNAVYDREAEEAAMRETYKILNYLK